jgi:hypothetical protein
LSPVTPDSIPLFDLYAELEVSRLASVAVIEAAYRSLAKSHHPDVAHGGESDRIKRLNTAREWLVDPVRRRRYDWATNAGLSNARPPATEWPKAPEPGADSTATEASFGPKAAQVREFLADLRTLDEQRAEQVWNGRAVAQAKGYPSARQAAVLAGRTHRHAAWLFAREAASVIARGKLGDSTLTDQVLDVLADAAGAIAIRDLITAADYDALLVPWNWGRREPATAVRPSRRSAKPAAATTVAATPSVAATPQNGRAEAPATAVTMAAAMMPATASGMMSAGATSAFGGGAASAAGVGAVAGSAAGAARVAGVGKDASPESVPEAPMAAPVAAGIGAAVRAAANAYRAGPIGSAVAINHAPPDSAAAGAAAGAAAAGVAAAAAAPVPPLARPMSIAVPVPARPSPALAPAPMPIAAVREPRVARLRSPLVTSRAVIFAVFAVVMVVGVAFGLAASKPETAVADVTDAPSGTTPAVVTGVTSPAPSTAVVAATPAGTTDPATLVPEPSAAATPLRTAKPGTVPVGGPTSTPKVTERPTSTALPTPATTPSPTAAPTPTAVPTDVPTPTAAPTPSPTAAPTPTGQATCTVVNLVNVDTSDAQDLWDDAGFTGPVVFTPDLPPNYTIKWQNLPAGWHVPCSWGVSVRQTKPWWA